MLIDTDCLFDVTEHIGAAGEFDQVVQEAVAAAGIHAAERCPARARRSAVSSAARVAATRVRTACEPGIDRLPLAAFASAAIPIRSPSARIVAVTSERPLML